MSKTVKHCEVCQENFGERFSYCPVCGETLKSVEVGASQAYSASSNGAAAQAPPPMVPREETVAAAAVTTPLSQESIPAYAPQESAAANGSANFKPNEPQITSENFDTNAENYHNDGLYHLTILQAPKTHRRDFGRGAGFALGFMLVALTSLFIWDIFNFPLDIDPVDADMGIPYAFLADNEPTPVEKEEPVKKDNSDGGGGGGGGKRDKTPPQEGEPPRMSREKQQIAPDVDRVIQPDFELKQAPTIQAPIEKKTASTERYGVVNGSKDRSGGWGSDDRGIGNGSGTGVGPGSGPGYGPGSGGGYGGGNGGGIGPGNGRGTGRDPIDNEDPPPVKAVTEPLKILSQPRPGYTEEARKNNVQGTVRVRVTFSASGQVTGVSAISSLPYGLTEKAIAAARQIQFVPMKKNGVPQSVQKVIEFRFTMY